MATPMAQNVVSFTNSDAPQTTGHTMSDYDTDVIDVAKCNDVQRPPRALFSYIRGYMAHSPAAQTDFPSLMPRPTISNSSELLPRSSDSRINVNCSPKLDVESLHHLSPIEPPVAQNTHDFGLIPIPLRLRYNIDKPPEFGIALNVLFALASTFLVANAYYCQPLLIEMSKTFNVDYSQISTVPTLAQAGYAVGLFLLSPLGDITRPRRLILCLVTVSTSLSLGLCFASTMSAFGALTFLTCAASITPQLLLPLAADLTPAHRRGSAIALCISGLLLGVLLARVLAGMIAQFTHWRYTYYLAVGVQFAVGSALAGMLPDFPARNPRLTYIGVLQSMGRFAITEPVLAQAALVNFASVACFANFWVTLTFLLGGAPYGFTTLQIGLFGLLGAAGVLAGPFVGKIADILPPWQAALLGTVGYTASQAIQLGAGGTSIIAVAFACVGLDIFRQLQQVSLTRAALELEPSARGRLNTVVILSIFLGQVMGTRVGTNVFISYGWRANAALAMGWMGIQFLLLFIRGPNVPRHTWLGWTGGWRIAACSTAITMKADLEKAVEVDKAFVIKEVQITAPKQIHIANHA